MTLWEVDIHPAPGQPNLEAQRVAAEAADLGIAIGLRVHAARGYLVEGDLDGKQIALLASQLLADGVVEETVVELVGQPRLAQLPQVAAQRPEPALVGNGPVKSAGETVSDTAAEAASEPAGQPRLVHVLPKPGVMDPVAQSARAAIDDFELHAAAVRTLRKYWLTGLDDLQLQALCSKVLANDSIEQVVVGPFDMERLDCGSAYIFEPVTVPLRELDDDALLKLSQQGQLYLTLVEMQTIRDDYRELDRDPTDVELETIAQTWSEHCSHKTLAGRISYRDEKGERRFENMLKETIFAATDELRRQWGADDWCVSVFDDNAGVVRFDDQDNVVFKVETHNHPSALEPYGGANTGIGGVIRDTLGTGLVARPVCNNDVFCFAPPDLPLEQLPPGVLHPRRVMKGVVAGVRDYGNRMGIPTVNGAICFDRRYLGNPLVFCGNVGIVPVDKSFKEPQAGDHVVVVGGRTGRDGIHGATFSSAELTHQSEDLSGGAVQIGNAITEKMVQDVIVAARDRGLFSAITDCGAGGLSSAVGEMGEQLGAQVWLEQAPLKYEGLSYTEIWISEAQERMVLSVPPARWEEFEALCASEGVEATIIGSFGHAGAGGEPSLRLTYNGHQVADLDMRFLHKGRPPVVREAVYLPAPVEPLATRSFGDRPATETLLAILGSLNVASKEWVIRQYDHEVQGGSVIKPLVGIQNDGPSDAAVVRPKLSSRRGLVVACGINPRYGDLDPYHMAASAIDEAVRNCVAVGSDPRRIAILDNFCWGYTDRSETLGSLVRAALACHDVAIDLGTPFISGKDSLNNEFSYEDPTTGRRETIGIPATLLISALGQVEDVSFCITMDLKQAGNLLYLVGATRDELGGSHFALVEGLTGGQVPRVDPPQARQTFEAMHNAIHSRLVRACHDLSEGGLAVAAAEMAFAGGLGARLDVTAVPGDANLTNTARLFAESNTRFLCEVPAAAAESFSAALAGVPHARLGEVIEQPVLTITSGDEQLIAAPLATLKEAWQAPLRW